MRDDSQRDAFHDEAAILTVCPLIICPIPARQSGHCVKMLPMCKVVQCTWCDSSAMTEIGVCCMAVKHRTATCAMHAMEFTPDPIHSSLTHSLCTPQQTATGSHVLQVLPQGGPSQSTTSHKQNVTGEAHVSKIIAADLDSGVEASS